MIAYCAVLWLFAWAITYDVLRTQAYGYWSAKERRQAIAASAAWPAVLAYVLTSKRPTAGRLWWFDRHRPKGLRRYKSVTLFVNGVEFKEADEGMLERPEP